MIGIACDDRVQFTCMMTSIRWVGAPPRRRCWRRSRGAGWSAAAERRRVPVIVPRRRQRLRRAGRLGAVDVGLRAGPAGAGADRGGAAVRWLRTRRWTPGRSGAVRPARSECSSCRSRARAAARPERSSRESAAAQALLRAVAQAARTSMPVLLTGETGTGKEVAARLIHQWSARRARTFVPINCAAIPNELMEGELFGYAKGAFSGAVRELRRPGHRRPRAAPCSSTRSTTRPHAAAGEAAARARGPGGVAGSGENAWRKVDFRHRRGDQPRPAAAHRAGDASAPTSTSGWPRAASSCRRCASGWRTSAGWSMQLHRALLPRRSRRAPSAARVRGVTPEALEVLRALPLARQHPRAAQRHLRRAGGQARGRRAAGLGPAAAAAGGARARRAAAGSSTCGAGAARSPRGR